LGGVDRLVVGDPSPTGDAVLDEALQIVNRCQVKPSTVIQAQSPLQWRISLRNHDRSAARS
jgi:hypothetical protein